MTIIPNLPVFTIISLHNIQVAPVPQEIYISHFDSGSDGTSRFIEVETVIKSAIL
jgi:hypothetical protein